ncbi:MAG TPA: HEAT repeat domain-containing protein [Gemmatimonadales bacterium]|nr:HEAT repeat domain-containing protein [Gemmatimonadales bacterium]
MQGFVSALLVGLGGLFLLVLSVVLLTKTWRGAREGYERRRRALLLPSIVAYANAESGLITDFVPTPLKGWNRRVVEWLLLDHIRSLRGHAQARLALAFEQLGFVAQAHAQLTHRRWWVRVEGAEKLGRMLARPTVPDLIRLMDDPVPEVRLRAAKALGAIGGLAAVETLISALKATDRWATLRIADILSGLGPSAVEPLLAAFPRLPPAARIPAIDILGRLRSHLAVPLLRGLLADPDPNARARAAHSLGLIGHPAVTAPLVEALVDPEWPVRAMAAKALGRISGDESVDALRRALSDSEWWVRANAAESLRSKGDAGRRALLVALEGGDAFAAHKAAWMLQEAGVLDALLARLGQGTEDERREALGVLRRLVALKRTDLLQDIASRHPDAEVRAEVGRLLQAEAVSA